MTFQEALQQISDNCDMEFSVRSYSGRGMYGKTCLAIDGDNINTVELGYLLGSISEIAQESFLYELRGMCSDSMGLGMVYYWSHVPFVGTEKSYDAVSEDDD